jgi:hypothetical protein
MYRWNGPDCLARTCVNTQVLAKNAFYQGMPNSPVAPFRESVGISEIHGRASECSRRGPLWHVEAKARKQFGARNLEVEIIEAGQPEASPTLHYDHGGHLLPWRLAFLPDRHMLIIEKIGPV